MPPCSLDARACQTSSNTTCPLLHVGLVQLLASLQRRHVHPDSSLLTTSVRLAAWHCRQKESLQAEAEAQTAKVRSALAYLETWQQCQRLWLSMGSLYSSQVSLPASSPAGTWV